DTTTLDDGLYDLRAVATDTTGAPVFSPTLAGLRIDNTPPRVALDPPGSSLTGRIELTAEADDGSGSGIASVRFERAATGTGTWVPIGSARVAPYTVRFDTTTVPNGVYDLRAVATDQAGSTADSVPVDGVTITNAAAPPQQVPSIADMAAPAHDL